MRPVRYRGVRSIPLKYVRDFIFDPFLRFFSVCLSRRCPRESRYGCPWCPVIRRSDLLWYYCNNRNYVSPATIVFTISAGQCQSRPTAVLLCQPQRKVVARVVMLWHNTHFLDKEDKDTLTHVAPVTSGAENTHKRSKVFKKMMQNLFAWNTALQVLCSNRWLKI